MSMDTIPRHATSPLPLPVISVHPSQAAPRRLHFVPRVFAGATLGVAVIVLCGWLFSIPSLRSIGPSTAAATNPTAALLLALGAIALWLAATDKNDAQPAVRVLCLGVFGISLACFVDGVGGYGVGIDQLFFGSAMRSTGDGRSNHIAPVTAAAMVLFAVALLVIRRKSARLAWAQAALLANLMLSGTVLLAFVYHAGWFDGVGSATRMARPTAFGLTFLTIGALAMRPSEGLTVVVTSAGPGGALARRLLPAGVIVPILIGAILLKVVRADLVKADLAIMLFVLATVLTFTALIGWNATQVHETHEERTHAEEALRDSEVRFRLLAENASDVVCLHDLDGRTLYVSPSCERVFGFTPEEVARMRPFAIVHPEDRARSTAHHEALLRGEPVTALTCRHLHKSGRHVWVETSWRPILNRTGKIVRLQAASRDVTERREYERQLEEAKAKLQAQQERLMDANSRLEALASLDSLTGLKNRRAFEERLHEEISRARRSKECFALLLLDIDHFKNFNDSFGHPRGDDVLKSVARVLSRSVRDADFIARYGGEEFACILPDTDRDAARVMGERLRVAIEENAWDARPITVSVGAAAWLDGASAESLIDQADRALYRSKQGGRNLVTLADAA
jgi:diguanylate cyclase (GGDEF)-like protein/PAS domain S-box-containing protein